MKSLTNFILTNLISESRISIDKKHRFKLVNTDHSQERMTRDYHAPINDGDLMYAFRQAMPKIRSALTNPGSMTALKSGKKFYVYKKKGRVYHAKAILQDNDWIKIIVITSYNPNDSQLASIKKGSYKGDPGFTIEGLQNSTYWIEVD